MNFASLCSLAGRYKNPIPPRCLAPTDFLKIPALEGLPQSVSDPKEASRNFILDFLHQKTAKKDKETQQRLFK
jgi:hypothetical protein